MTTHLVLSSVFSKFCYYMLVMHNDVFHYDIFCYLLLYISCLHSYFFISFSSFFSWNPFFSLQGASPVFISACASLSKRRVICMSTSGNLFPRAWAPLSGYTTEEYEFSPFKEGWDLTIPSFVHINVSFHSGHNVLLTFHDLVYALLLIFARWHKKLVGVAAYLFESI